MKSNNIISYLKLVICILSAIVSAGLMACSNIHNNGSKSSSNDLKPLIMGSEIMCLTVILTVMATLRELMLR